MELRKRDRREKMAHYRGTIAGLKFALIVLESAIGKIRRHREALKLQMEAPGKDKKDATDPS
jgi:hypothetical protein